MPLGREVDVGPGDIVLDGDPAPSPKEAQPSIFGSCLLWPNGRLSQLLLRSCCTAHGRKYLYFTMGASIHQNCYFAWADLDHHLTHDANGHMRAHSPNGTSIASAVFAQMTAECPYSLQRFACSPLKIAPSYEGIWTPGNTWFIRPTRVLNSNGNSIASAVFAALTSFHRDTDRRVAFKFCEI